jgi:FtsH-binding integral membrane protein
MELLKTVVGKVATGLVALGVVAGAISWSQMDDQTRQMLLRGVERIALWLGVVLVWPWASFALIGRIARAESNLAAGLLIAAYSLAEALLLAWLFHWQILTSTAWTFLLFGGLLAATYNLLICDWIAEKVHS